MLQSRHLSCGPNTQVVSSELYTSIIIVMRKQVKPLTEEFDGDFGSNQIEYVSVARGWPASIISNKTEVEFIPPGQTERGDYLLVCPWKQMQDGKLLIRERDIIIEMGSGLRHLVLWSYDPLNIHQQIVAAIQFGVVNENLEVQG